jgi:pimeloyl-ACP methyl ester carboxylesterase
MPPLPTQGKQVRAFYAWDGGRGCLFFHSTSLIQRDLRAFLQANPGADLVFVGHSYGGSAIMDVLRHLNTPHGRTVVVTLDAVSCRERSHPRERAEGVDYWVNVYCQPYRHFKDLAAAIGGPWRECPQADLNIAFSGKERDRADRRYQHAQPLPLFEDRAPGQIYSAYEHMVSACNRLHVGLKKK